MYSILLWLIIGIAIERERSVDTEARVFYSDNKWTISDKILPSEEPFVAQGYYSFTQKENGWNSVAITTNAAFPDEIQAEGAGRIEAYLTKDQIYDY